MSGWVANPETARVLTLDDILDERGCAQTGEHQWWWNNGHPACVECGAKYDTPKEGDS